MEKIKCSECQLYKETEEFSPSLQYSRGYDYRCKECNRNRANLYHAENKEMLCKKWREQRKEWSEEKIAQARAVSRDRYWADIRRNLLYAAYERSKKHGWVCDLSIDDIVIPEKCPLLEVPFEKGTRTSKWYTYSIDRIDNSKGYIRGNIQVITYLANTMKSRASRKELIRFAHNILELLK